MLLVAVLAGCGDGGQDTADARMQELIGKNLADVTVQTLDGQVQPLHDVFALDMKKPTVVNVWATWCTPCLAEMPTLDALGKQGRFNVIAIATDKDAATVKAFLKKQDWGSGVHVWFDSLGAVTRDAMAARAIPVTLVLDPSMTVRMAVAGERKWDHPKMVAKMDEALGFKGTR